jgi:hypothetical protein
MQTVDTTAGVTSTTTAGRPLGGIAEIRPAVVRRRNSRCEFEGGLVRERGNWNRCGAPFSAVRGREMPMRVRQRAVRVY